MYNDFRHAWLVAAEKHNGQKYPGTDLPYLTHIGAVVLELQQALMPWHDYDCAIKCAILHDLLEDTEADYAYIAKEFGPAVADGVLALTKNPELEGIEAMKDSLERIQKQPKSIWLVKLADRAANLYRTNRSWSKEKHLRYVEESQLIVDALGEASSCLTDLITVRMADWECAYA